MGGRWCLCGSCVRWPADLLEPLPHVRGEVPQTDHHPPPQRGETGILSWLVVLRYGVSRLFTGGAGRRRLFRAFLLFSGFLYAFDSLAGAFDSPSKRGTSRYGSDPPPKRVCVMCVAREGSVRTSAWGRGGVRGVNGVWCGRERERVKSVCMRMGECVCTWGNACECGRAWWGDACRAVFSMATWLGSW